MTQKFYHHIYFFLLLFFASTLALKAQGGGVALDIGEKPTGITRALVIGIANYEDDSIPKLRFSNRDATIFAKFLETNEGGNVDSLNITLLTDSKATRAHIYAYMQRLISKSKAGDKAIIYFSGHGDVEVESQEGYLIPYDSPPNNYLGMAVSVYDLKTFLRILTTKGVDVVLVTDACRSGNLAGNAIGGTVLTAQSLEKVPVVTKILSCQPSQNSIEDPRWGGGRGVFSYYLIKGLGGAADMDNNRKVTALEVQNYLMSQVPNAVAPKNQIPLVEAQDYTYMLSEITPGDSSVFALNEQPVDSALLNSGPLLVERAIIHKPASKGGYAANTPTPTDTLMQAFERKLATGELLEPQGQCAYSYCQQLIKQKDVEDKELPKFLLAIALQDEAQKVIKRYLVTDSTEANRKQMLADSFLNNYHPEYLEVAAKLLGKDYQFKDELKAKSYYYQAVQIRLDADINPKGNTKAAHRKALKKLKKAAQYLGDAAYVHNELGLNYEALGQKKLAAECYNLAQKNAPTWYVPYSNEIGVRVENGETEQAKETAQTAVKEQPRNLKAYLEMGQLLEKEGQYIQAEQAYRDGLTLNNKKPAAFERLGYLYLKTGDFAAANDMFYEADLRRGDVPGMMPENQEKPAKEVKKENNESKNNENTPTPYLSQRRGYLLRLMWRNPADAATHFKLGTIYRSMNWPNTAERRFRSVISIDPANVDAYNQLLDLQLQRNRLAPAELMLNKTQMLQPGSNLDISMGLYKSWQRYDKLEGIYRQVDSLALLYPHYIQERRFDRVFNLALAEFAKSKDYAVLGKWNDFMIQKDIFKADDYFQSGLYWTNEAVYTAVTVEFAKSGNQVTTTDGKSIALSQSDRVERAFQAFNQVLTLDSSYAAKADIFRRLSELTRIKTDIAQRDHAPIKTETSLVQQTLDYLNKALDAAPDNVDLQLQKIKSLIELKQYDEATAALEKMHEAHQLNVEGELSLAKLWFLNGKKDDARGLLDNIQRYFIPTSDAPDSYFRLDALLQMNQDKNDEAIADLGQILSRSYGSINDYYQQARLLTAKGDEEKALAVLNGAMESGLRYERVLKYDPMLQKIRESSAFTDLLGKFSVNLDQPKYKSQY